ncbi:anti-sigma-K factor RskA [Bradyrhizobium japonicum]|uniref:anti-sigma factor n=1 Tax=Bradyrhizobium TaxID=374 RepID=UPI0003F4C17B|nr:MULTISPECIES: anti-sigma factor [Bradyrhizobium]MBR0879695.1 anti-sigma factor [Bradyrhizobium liaoningense]MBR0942479.1 anti-sigma factor [Bradyrhizobium liaoningense]MBR0999699.1 anti-sigma factor [Bradyrhizobium liaoningense]MBR1026406.1 anti-sigma factor [Bradyrhizobium liaoningense]MBR1065590.1 anti-sigma factor [Bradyrhizobium liaoningense]
MAYTEDHIALAAEYALGTLDADERVQVETMMAVDKAFADVVQAWAYRLGVLNQMVGSVEPRPIVWENIRSELARTDFAQETPAPEASPPPPPVPEFSSIEAAPPELAPDGAPQPEPQPSEAEQPGTARPAPDVIPDIAPIFMPQVHAPDPDVARAPPAPVADNSNVIRLEGRVKRWRTIASAVGALAAALLVTLSLQIFQPDALPGGLRPAPRIQTVEVKTPAPLTAAAQYVALLQGQGGGPAFILTIDGATRNFTVRKVGATPEAGKSFELWLISDKLPRPRSLGVIGAGDFTARPVLGSFDPEVVNGATYAVTVEQAGGSPNGQPTSAPVFSGKLIETVPPSQPQAPAKK